MWKWRVGQSEGTRKWKTGWSGCIWCDCADREAAGRGPLRARMSPDKAQIFTAGTPSQRIQLLTAANTMSTIFKVSSYREQQTQAHCLQRWGKTKNMFTVCKYIRFTVIKRKQTCLILLISFNLDRNRTENSCRTNWLAAHVSSLCLSVTRSIQYLNCSYIQLERNLYYIFNVHQKTIKPNSMLNTVIFKLPFKSTNLSEQDSLTP